jgi:hypothetical protein
LQWARQNAGIPVLGKTCRKREEVRGDPLPLQVEEIERTIDARSGELPVEWNTLVVEKDVAGTTGSKRQLALRLRSCSRKVISTAISVICTRRASIGPKNQRIRHSLVGNPVLSAVDKGNQ